VGEDEDSPSPYSSMAGMNPSDTLLLSWVLVGESFSSAMRGRGSELARVTTAVALDSVAEVVVGTTEATAVCL